MGLGRNLVGGSSHQLSSPTRFLLQHFSSRGRVPRNAPPWNGVPSGRTSLRGSNLFRRGLSGTLPKEGHPPVMIPRRREPYAPSHPATLCVRDRLSYGNGAESSPELALYCDRPSPRWQTCPRSKRRHRHPTWHRRTWSGYRWNCCAPTTIPIKASRASSPLHRQRTRRRPDHWSDSWRWSARCPRAPC